MCAHIIMSLVSVFSFNLNALYKSNTATFLLIVAHSIVVLANEVYIYIEQHKLSTTKDNKQNISSIIV